MTVSELKSMLEKIDGNKKVVYKINKFDYRYIMDVEDLGDEYEEIVLK